MYDYEYEEVEVGENCFYVQGSYEVQPVGCDPYGEPEGYNEVWHVPAIVAKYDDEKQDYVDLPSDEAAAWWEAHQQLVKDRVADDAVAFWEAQAER